MATKKIPHPGYTTHKPWLPALETLFKSLGEQDACIQMQEAAQRFLEATAKGMGTKTDSFLQILYQAHQVPHGTYNFSQMRRVAHCSYVTLTYASFEAALKEAISDYTVRTGVTWIYKDSAGKNIAPLPQVPHNLPACAAKIKSAPEYRLLEYYRFVRIAESHRTQATQAAAQAAFARMSSSDLQHFLQYTHIKSAPNQPSDINFEDFKLFTRAVKYYSNLLNDALA